MITIAITSINYIKIENSIVDQIEIRERTSGIDLTSTKGNWEIDTVLLAEFLNNLEAGNVNNEGLVITKFRIKRRNSGELTNITVGEVDYDYLNPTTLEFTDYSQPVGNFIYSIIPVGINGLEGKPSEQSITSEFYGWWIVDKNNSEVFEFGKQYGGENRTVDVSLEQGRTEIQTMSQYPSVYYTPQQFARFNLSAVVVPNNYSITEWNNLVSMITQHVPLIVKSNNGDIYVCDVYAPSKQVLLNKYTTGDPFNINISCVEIMAYQNYMSL